MSESETTQSQGASNETTAAATPQETQATSPPSTSPDKSDAVKAAQGDALTPDQKHKNYLDDIERLHNEP